MTTDNVTKLYPSNAAENPDNVLEQAVGSYASVFVIGYDHDGELDVRSTSGLKFSDVAFLLQTFLHKLFNGDYSS